MRVTIVADDNNVIVDGVREIVDCSDLAAQDTHAVQWQDTTGEVEYKNHVDLETKSITRKPNEIIDDFSPYQPYLDAWQVEHDKRLEAEREEAARQAKLRAEAEKPREPPPPLPLPVYSIYHDHENRLRALEGKPPQTMEEFFADQKRIYAEAVAKAKKEGRWEGPDYG